MDQKSGYRQQKNLALVQFLAEVPDFVSLLVSAVFSGSLIVIMDLLDSFGELLRTAVTARLSKKLSVDLRFEYNYGVGKIEAISALLCDGIVFFGLVAALGFSVYEIINPGRPSDLLIWVVGLKLINVSFDTVFFVKQRRILKCHHSAIGQSGYAAARGSLLFDCAALVSLLVIWLLRHGAVVAYVSPAVSIAIALWLMGGCIRRIRTALDELTEKTLPEEMQLQILKVLTNSYDSYAQLHAVKSCRDGSGLRIDLVLSFAPETTYDRIAALKKQLQEELSSQLENCTVNLSIADL